MSNSMLRHLVPTLLIGLSGCAILSRAPSDDLAQEPANGQHEQIVLYVTSNIRGALLRSPEDTGGAPLLEGTYKVAQRDFGNRVIWLDAGSLRGQSFESE